MVLVKNDSNKDYIGTHLYAMKKDDNKYGSLVFCRIKTAGAVSKIKIVDIKVK